MAETRPESRYARRLRQERELGAREGAVQAREQAAAQSPSGPARRSGSGPGAASTVRAAHRQASRRPYLALMLAADVIVWVQLGRNGKLQKGEKYAAAFASVVLLLAVGLVGELSPEIATGFAGLLLVSVLLGGTDAVGYLFLTIPRNLSKAA